MSSNLLSPSSDSTYCSELERTEERFKNVKKFKINFNPSCSAKTREKLVQSPLIQKTLDELESQCKEKLSDLSKYYEETIGKFQPNGFSKQRFSPSLLSPSYYTQEDDIIPLTQIPNKSQTQKLLLQRIPSNTLINTSQRSIIKSQTVTSKITNHDKIREPNFKAPIYDQSYRCKPKNKIFNTEEKFDSLNRRDFDTLSITSESVSKIVDKEIELHRKKRLVRLKHKSQHDLPRNNYPDVAHCPCVTNLISCHMNPSQTSASSRSQQKLSSHNLDEVRQYTAVSSTQSPKNYNLTKSQIKKIAKHFKIDTNELTSIVETLLSVNEIDEQISDDNDEINCSQSPIKRRYTCSQYINTSDASK